MTSSENVDRLPVIKTAPNIEQIIGVPQLISGSGNEIASVVNETLQE